MGFHTDRALSKMNGINRLDAFVLNRGSMVKRATVGFAFGGKDYVATCGARDTEDSLTEGGYHHDSDLTLLVETSQFGNDTRPAEKDKITLCVDADGVPCPTEEAVGERVEMRIERIGRSGGGASYELKTATRG